MRWLFLGLLVVQYLKCFSVFQYFHTQYVLMSRERSPLTNKPEEGHMMAHAYILAPWKLRSKRHKLKASLGYTLRPCIKNI